jgi:thioredoxin 1
MLYKFGGMDHRTYAEVISQPLVLVDFWASWCEPCQMLDRILDELKVRIPELVIHKVNVDQNPDWAEKEGIKSVPVLILFKSGKEVWRMNGFDLAPELEKVICRFL